MSGCLFHVFILKPWFRLPESMMRSENSQWSAVEYWDSALTAWGSQKSLCLALFRYDSLCHTPSRARYRAAPGVLSTTLT